MSVTFSIGLRVASGADVVMDTLDELEAALR
jgi:hypothetical protein